MTLIIFIIFHIICGVLAYGITFAHFQREFSLTSHEDVGINRVLALFMACSGIVGLVIIYIFSDFAKHGLKYKK